MLVLSLSNAKKKKKKKRMDSDQDADFWLDSILNIVFGHTLYKHLSPDSPLNMEDLQPAPPKGCDHSAMLPAAPPYENNAHTRFQLKSDTALEEVKASSVPKNTVCCTKWAQKIWQEWSKQRQITYPNSHGEWRIHLLIVNNEQLDKWLSKFIIEVRRYDDQPYPPNTLYNICCGLLHHIREAKPEINIFKDNAFSGFRRNLDVQMKILRSTGHSVQAKQAEPLTIDKEDQLCKGGYLGDHSPQVLLDTMLYLCKACHNNF